MSTEKTVNIYWPDVPFAFVHHARKYQIANGDNSLPESMAKRLKQRFAVNGMVDVPAELDEKTLAAVKAAADARNASANRNAGQGPLPDAAGAPRVRTGLPLREGAGAKIVVEKEAEAAPESEEAKAEAEKKAKAEAKAAAKAAKDAK
jgi:hypothetical protein